MEQERILGVEIFSAHFAFQAVFQTPVFNQFLTVVLQSDVKLELVGVVDAEVARPTTEAVGRFGFIR